MTPRSLLLISAAAIVGWGTGAVMRGPQPEVGPIPPPASSQTERVRGRKEVPDAVVPSPSSIPLRSPDTLESLKLLRGGELHARLALWLIDASPEDIADFWDHYRTTWADDDRSPAMSLLALGAVETGRAEISELIFYHWLQHDPSATMAAAEKDHLEYWAWRAWTAQDPEGALAAATGKGPRAVEEVARALGTYRISWLRQHLEELPEAARKLALAMMSEDESGNDPAANLRFLAKHGYGLRPESFASAIRDDPWAAYDWIEYLAKSGHGKQAREQREEFIRLAGKEHPEVIEALARTTPEGAMKRKMEDVLFRSRLDVDPEGAVQEAMETRAPAVAVDRLSEAGKLLATSDPERAFELAKRMFDFCPDAFDTGIEIRSGNSINNYGGMSNQGPEFAKALMAIDPGRVLDLALAGNDNGTSSSTFSQLTGMWAATDPAGLGEWAEGQADPVHDAALYSLLMRQQEQGVFPKELDLAVRIRGSQRKDYLESILTRWNAVNPEATAEWLAGSGLPAAEIEALEKTLPAKSKP